MQNDRLLAYFMILPVVAAVLAFVVGPTYNVGTLSLTQVVMGQERGFGTLGNFRALINDPVFLLVMKNTAIWIVGGTLACVSVGLAVGTFLAIDSKMTTGLRALILLPWVLPDVVTAMAWKWMLHGQVGIIGQTLTSTGLTDEPISFMGDPDLVMWMLVVVLVWRKMPLVALILCAAIRSVPDEQLEAARMDGATAFERFRFVVIPNIAFSLTAVTVISMIWITAEFALPWIMTGGGPANASQIMATYIYQQSFEFFNWGVASAMSVVNLVMLASIVGLYLYINRRSWASEGTR
ncbi:carbohydrate ABC transporter permease [Jannaschia sp. M317]|uniref:carbohydrate ABC transporter permease n=1 Tax=Jannaschia sp. M317 TaxID=2867011 RepID=UPI0021A4477F|nr:sugar ABC transporter permease [Jannaschia sp. M317]UWQ19819.1 sugar ABC transporter permease [Jannaschia sp. M317]